MDTCPDTRRGRSKLQLQQSGGRGNLLATAFSQLQRRHLDLFDQAEERGCIVQLAKQMWRGSTTAAGKPYTASRSSFRYADLHLPWVQLLSLIFSTPSHLQQ